MKRRKQGKAESAALSTPEPVAPAWMNVRRASPRDPRNILKLDTTSAAARRAQANHDRIVRNIEKAIAHSGATLTTWTGDGMSGGSLQHKSKQPTRVLTDKTIALIRRCAALEDPKRYRHIVEAEWPDLEKRVARQRFASIKSKNKPLWNSFLKK